MNHVRNGYVAKFFKDLYFIPSLLITSILCTIFIGSEGFGVFDSLVKGGFTYYIMTTAGFFTLVYIVYALAESKNKKLNIVDPTNFAIMITAILYVLFVIFVSKKITLLKLVIPGALFLVMVFVTTMRTVYFNPYDEKGKIYYTKHSVNAYYHTLVKKHSFFGIYLFALAITCLAYLVIKSGFTLNLKSSRIILPLSVAGLFLSFLIFSSISKKISVIDAAILGMTLSLPPVLSQILFLTPNTILKDIYLSYWAIILGIVLILTLLRYVFFDISKIGKNSAEDFSDVRIINYFKKVSNKYGLGTVITVSFAAAVILLLMLTFADVRRFFMFDEGILKINFSIIPTLVVNLLFIGTCLLGVVLTVINIKSLKITFADFLMLTNLLFSIVALGVFALQKTFDWRIYSLGALFIYSLVMTIFRILNCCPKKID